jgi:hypothetical protein
MDDLELGLPKGDEGQDLPVAPLSGTDKVSPALLFS